MKDNENLNQNDVSFIKKLCTKLHTAKIGQKINSLIISGAMIFSLGACANKNNNNNNNNSDTNISENGNNNSNSNNTENPYSQYSELLQSVLLNEEYDKLIAKVKTGSESILKKGYFQPHPYGFLEDEGYDINAIKESEDIAYSMSYILEDEPNNLYVHTRLLIDDSYYTHYLLKYQLTDKELKDYRQLHGGKGHYYIQARFMNDVISQTKTPQLLSQSKIKKQVFDNLLSSFNTIHLDYAYVYGIAFTDFNPEDNSFKILMYPNDGMNRTYNDNILSVSPFKSTKKSNPEIYDGDSYLLYLTSMDGGYEKNAIFYQCQNVDEYICYFDNFETKYIN